MKININGIEVETERHVDECINAEDPTVYLLAQFIKSLPKERKETLMYLIK